MSKKCIAIALTLALGAFPAMASPEDAQVELMQSLNIISGYDDGSMRLENAVSRAEFTKMAVEASSYRDSVAQNMSVSPFNDVSYTYWAAPYIQLSVSNGLITGYKDATFRPENTVLYEEALTVALRILGYTDSDFGSSWPYGQVGIAKKLGLTDGLSAAVGQEMTRGDIITILYNMLNTKAKNSTSDYISNIGYTLQEDMVVIATANEDPSVGSDKVYTSAGTYKINQWFDTSIVGKKGTALIKDNEMILFFPDAQEAESYNVYSVVGDNVVLFRDGAISDYKLDTGTAVYYKSSKSTIALLKSEINPGDYITLYRNASGTMDYAVLQSNTLQGPVTVKDGNWQSTLGVSEYATVTRDGSPSSLDKIQNYDVVYYSPELSTVWAYSKKITGVYEKADPNREQVSSVTISGVDYTVNSIAAYSALGASGGFRIGDTVTLLMGRDGSVVDAISPENADIDTYVVYSTLDSDVIVYDNGDLTQLNLDKTTTAYYNSTKLTLSTVISSLKMGDIISVIRNTDDSIDYITVSTGKVEGPVTASAAGWTSELNVKSGAIVMRDGKKVTQDEVKAYDVVYYSKDMNMVWAYSKKVTGVYEKASPNKDSISTVTVSGTSYSIESAAAMKALSSGGSFNLGDNVTLLLGKDGKIADVVSPSAIDQTVYGYLVSVGSKEYSDANGNTKMSYYAQVALPDGTVMEYITKSKYEYQRCSVIKLTFTDGVATVAKVQKTSGISGTLSASALTLGKTKISEDVDILDVGTTDFLDTGSYTTVFLQRLDGVTIDASDVLYAEKNAAGEITKLILDNVTGDCDQYGIITSVGNSYVGMVGSDKTTISTGSTYSVLSGQPVRYLMSGSSIDGILGITLLSGYIKNVTSLYVETENGKYALSDKVVVYDSKYMVLPLEEIINSTKYRLEAYYDTLPSKGGRIRVIKAYAK